MNCWQPILLTLCLKVCSFSLHFWKAFLVTQVSRLASSFSGSSVPPSVTTLLMRSQLCPEFSPCVSLLCSFAASQASLLSVAFSGLEADALWGGLLHVSLLFNERLVSPNLHLHHIFSCLTTSSAAYFPDNLSTPLSVSSFWYSNFPYIGHPDVIYQPLKLWSLKNFFLSFTSESFLLESFLLISHQSHFVFASRQLFDYQIHTEFENFRICVLFRNVHSVLFIISIFLAEVFLWDFHLLKKTRSC